jgi:hypothetical protein
MGEAILSHKYCKNFEEHELRGSYRKKVDQDVHDA